MKTDKISTPWNLHSDTARVVIKTTNALFQNITDTTKT
jgi:hypothetical protein